MQTIDVEQINALNQTLDGLKNRLHELRGYL